MSIEQLTEENINENATVNEEVLENNEAAEVVTEPTKEATKNSGKPTIGTYGKGEFLTDEQIAKKKKIAAVWDKITTGLLIALMASPIAIIGWIFLFFIIITLKG